MSEQHNCGVFPVKSLHSDNSEPSGIKWPTDIQVFETKVNHMAVKIHEEKKKEQVMRAFDSGATRDLDHDKIDPEACLSPLALEAYAEYMLNCTLLPDGSRRPGDNWQKGIPINSFMKSLWRHTLDVWKIHRGLKVYDKKTGKQITMKTALCAVLFNAMGYLHELVKKELQDGTN